MKSAIVPTSALLLALFLSATPTAAAAATCILNHICFSLDESGSMQNGEYKQEKDAVLKIARTVASRASGTSFSAIQFSRDARTIQRPTTDLEGKFVPALNAAGKRGGSTNMGRGLNLCFDNLQSTTGNRVIVLLTDGFDFNDLTPRIASRIKSAGVKIVTIALGNRVNEEYLRNLASTPSFFFFTAFDTIGSDALQITNLVCEAAKISPKPTPGGLRRTPGALGDPHMHGFDGTSFDFHGISGRQYAVFGRRGGDLVVATIRAAQVPEPGRRSRSRTYFREFGVRPRGTRARVRVTMLRCPVTGKWQLGVEVNDQGVVDEVRTESFRVWRDSALKVSVSTADADYHFKLMWPERFSAHLNFELGLRRIPQYGDAFHGLLGVTLNRFADVADDADVGQNVAPAVRERRLRRRFGVISLFPKWDTGTHKPAREHLSLPVVRVSAIAAA